MAEIYTIPVNSDDSAFEIRTILEDFELILFLYWNTRVERWYLTIYDSNKDIRLGSQPLHVDTEILTRFEIEGLPPGKLILHDVTGKSEECGREDLGDRCKLIYINSV